MIGPRDSAELHAAYQPTPPVTAVRLRTLAAQVAIVCALLAGGLLIPRWGWVLLALVSGYFAWTLASGWRQMMPVQRLMRATTLFLAVALTLSRACPR